MTANNIRTGPSTNGTLPAGQTYFEEQRSLLLNEIAVSLENVLQNMNNLNRSLEGIIAVGNEFGSVEALWSQFENVMMKDPIVEDEEKQDGEGGNEGVV